MTREEALSLLHEFVESESLRTHCLSVATSMAHFAKMAGEDEDAWWIAGLLHDYDYEKFPETHPEGGQEELEKRGVPADIRQAILFHDNRKDYVRETPMEKTLFAVDELSGFVVAVALVRPEKMEGMKVKSVKKKLKDKKFAAGVNRDDVSQGAEELGMELDVIIQNVIDALSAEAEALGHK